MLISAHTISQFVFSSVIHQLLDIIADHNLHQVTDKPTRNERTLDLLLMNNPSNLNKLCTLPPIGLADPAQETVAGDAVFCQIVCPMKCWKYENVTVKIM
jgi:hypothetical protein